MRRSLRGLCVLVFLLPAASPAGCGKKEHKLVPVTGVLKINNQPAANIMVRFMPDGQKGVTGPTSTAVTNERGEFTLQTDAGKPGAVPGWHRVTLDDLDVDRPAQGQPQKSAPRVHGKYATAGTALEVEVKDGGGPLTLEAAGP